MDGRSSGRQVLPKRRLKWHHMFMITISGTIGVGFFVSAGRILSTAGPGGALLAFGIVGFVACMVMEGICQMLYHWPIPNPMVEFVRVFVDRDLAIVVGLAYWYTYAITSVALVITVGNLVNFWNLSFPSKSALFVCLPILIILINSRSVLVFGIVEFFGGALKLTMVFGLFILMLLLDNGVGPGPKIGALCFNDGVRNNPSVASDHFIAVLVSLSLAVFPYIGVEMITVTAYEAENPEQSLRFTAKNVAVIVTVIYFLGELGFVLNVEWFNQALPQYYDQALVSLSNPTSFLGHTPNPDFLSGARSQALPVIATLQAGIPVLPGFITACLAYSAISAANTALYIASRTLYGLAQNLDPDHPSRLIRILSNLGTVTSDKRVPGWAVIVSCIFIWLPFIHLGAGYTSLELQEILISIGSTSCVLVWASQCLAFIRYRSWTKKHKGNLSEGSGFARYHPDKRDGFTNWLAWLGSLPAWIGLICCLLIVLVFASAGMWNGDKIFIKSMTIYLGPGVLLIAFILLKIINRRRWVSLGNWTELRDVLVGLEGLRHLETYQRPGAFDAGQGNMEFEAVSIHNSIRSDTIVAGVESGERSEVGNDNSHNQDEHFPFRMYDDHQQHMGQYSYHDNPQPGNVQPPYSGVQQVRPEDQSRFAPGVYNPQANYPQDAYAYANVHPGPNPSQAYPRRPVPASGPMPMPMPMPMQMPTQDPRGTYPRQHQHQPRPQTPPQAHPRRYNDSPDESFASEPPRHYANYTETTISPSLPDSGQRNMPGSHMFAATPPHWDPLRDQGADHLHDTTYARRSPPQQQAQQQQQQQQSPPRWPSP